MKTLMTLAAITLASGAVLAQPIEATPAAPMPVPVGAQPATPTGSDPLSLAASPTEGAVAPAASPAPDGVTPRADMPRQPVSQADANFFLRQAMLQREIRLLELEARRRELQDEVAGVSAAASAPIVSPGGPIIPMMAAPPQPASPPSLEGERPPAPPSLPFALVSIYGGEGIFTAHFAVGAARVALRPGGVLPGGWTVQAIEPFEVTVRRGTSERRLRL